LADADVCPRLRRRFANRFGAVCLVNSDSPTLPTACLIRTAYALLVPGDRIVLGQVDNDGYYLLGMKHPHSRLFADIACSTNGVAAATLARATALDLDVAALPTWFDVEDAATLNPLVAARITATSRRPPTHASNATDCTDA
jgi:glycosyltransferase A (GT-A) superfamily protein (DUF2064 family)